MRKLIFVSLGLTLAIGLAGGGFVLWRHHQTTEAATNSQSADGLVTLDTSTSGAKTIPLNTNSSNPNSESLQSGLPGQTTNSDGTPAASSNTPPTNAEYVQYGKLTTSQYIELRAGTGAEATTNKPLTINYRGWLTTGQLIDDSYISGRAPLSFTPGEHKVVSGMEAGVIGMKVGGKRRLILMPDAGYGSQGVGVVPANSILIFDVELVDAK